MTDAKRRMTDEEQDGEIRNAFAETMATQSVLTALMVGLQARGVIDEKFCKVLFDAVGENVVQSI